MDPAQLMTLMTNPVLLVWAALEIRRVRHAIERRSWEDRRWIESIADAVKAPAPQGVSRAAARPPFMEGL